MTFVKTHYLKMRDIWDDTAHVSLTQPGERTMLGTCDMSESILHIQYLRHDACGALVYKITIVYIDNLKQNELITAVDNGRLNFDM